MEQLDIIFNGQPGTLRMAMHMNFPLPGCKLPPKKLPRKPRLRPCKVRGEDEVIRDYMEWAHMAGVRTVHVFPNARHCPCVPCSTLTLIEVNPAAVFGPTLPDVSDAEAA